jgi:hypothetical protein
VRLAAPAAFTTPLEATLTAALLVAAGAPVLAAALLAAALLAPEPFRVVLAHAHNLVALALWLRLYRARTPAAWAVCAAAVAFAALLASGALVPILVGQGTLTIAGYSVLAAADTLAPGLPDTLAVGLTMSFAFLQSVHYAVWVTCIPLDAAGPRTFRQSLRAHRRDLGTLGLGAVALLAIALLAGGALAPLRAQSSYLALAGFHAYLELVAWALLRRERG